jgi:hypothetical protein
MQAEADSGENLSVVEPDVRKVYQAFEKAWSACRNDYDDGRVNAEHTLQAALYFHLRSGLDFEKYVVLTELKGNLSDSQKTVSGKFRDVLDLVVARRAPKEKGGRLEILAAIELKYLPRSVPSNKAIRKDLINLSRVWRNKESASRSDYKVERFNGPSTRVDVLNELVLIYGFFAERVAAKNLCESFWSGTRIPDSGRWLKKVGLPPKLVVAHCLTAKGAPSPSEVGFDGPLHSKYSVGCKNNQ